MPWVDLGKVVGKDGEIGNVGSTYINNGGDPGVNIVRSGDDGAPDFTFEFENLANDPLSESELEQIVAGQTVSSASVVNGTVLSNFMSALGSVFAAIDHKHDASDIDSGTLAAERIANDSIGTEKFKPAVRDSLSRIGTLAKNGYVADANLLMAGLWQFNPSTANAPIADSFGFILVLANYTNIDDTYLWRYQLGFSKGVYVRWKINANGVWSTWVQL